MERLFTVKSATYNIRAATKWSPALGLLIYLSLCEIVNVTTVATMWLCNVDQIIALPALR